MQTYELTLIAPISRSFMAEKARRSVDLDSDEKARHHLRIEGVDLKTPFNIGLIVGASGSGKSSLAREIFGDFSASTINPDRAIIDQFPSEMSYEERTALLNGVGLSQVPCWLKPVRTLSTGQQARAEAALQLSADVGEIKVFDEWTSVVDRNVAAAMSHTLQKVVRRKNASVVLVSCHFDIIDFLKPDWIIDCDNATFKNTRDLDWADKKKLNLTFAPFLAQRGEILKSIII